MPKAAWGWQVTPDELRGWILAEDGRWLVVNKPPLVVCHPSKHGPWSSLIGACREWSGCARLHMPWRLDRETSGTMLLIKDAAIGRDLQRAVAARRVTKTYHAILYGDLAVDTEVDGGIGKHPDSMVLMRRGVVPEGRAAKTRFVPLARGDGYTLAQVEPATGRMHQIRVHAAHIGHAVVGDKIYGPDEELYLEFLRDGYTARLAEQLKMNRQALHCSRVEFPALGLCFDAPMAEDMAAFCRDHGLAQ